jgi:hypothetical protein
MEKLLYWSDNRMLYMAISFGLLSLLAFLCVIPTLNNKTSFKHIITVLKSEYVFIFTLFAFVFAARWPSLFWYKGYSIDEDQFLSAAWTLIKDPIFFRSVETGSSGPMNIYPMLVSVILGIIPGFISIRLISLFMTCSALALSYFACKKITAIQYARTGILMPSAFFGLTSFWDFSGYSSEVPSILYLCIGLACASFIFNISCSNALFKCSVYGFFGAFFISLVPLAKLQGVYLALFTGGVLILAIFLNHQLTIKEKIWSAFFATCGGLVFPLMFSYLMWCSGSFDYFLNSYFLNALAYVDSGHQGFNPIVFTWQIIQKGIDFKIIFLGWSVIFTFSLLILSVIFFKKSRINGFLLFALCLLFVVLAFFTVIAPRRDWAHYLLFVPIYLGISLSVIMHVLDNNTCFIKIKYKSNILCVLVILFCVFPIGTYRSIKTNPWIGTAKNWMPVHSGTYSPVGKAILRAVSSNDSYLCVWGYNPDYHSETRLNQSTRLNISTAQFNANNLQPFFRRTYLEDLQKNKPEIFVDATARNQFPALNDPEKFRHEVIPEIRDFVAANYTLLEDIDGVRIYKWKEGQP